VHHALVAALDIGGTKIEGALVDRGGRLPACSRRPTPLRADGGTAALVEIEVAVVGGGVAAADEALFAPLRRAPD
jgi:glucokinase